MKLLKKNFKKTYEVIVFSNGVRANHTVKVEKRTDIREMFEGCKIEIRSKDG